MTIGRHEAEIPKSLPPRTVPLFTFLKDEAISAGVAVGGILEWCDHWIIRDIRVRKLAEELDIVKAEVSLSAWVLNIQRLIIDFPIARKTSPG